MLHNDLNDILPDEYSCSEYLDKDGRTRVKIGCTVSHDEKQCTLGRLRLKYAADCSISEEPTNLSIEAISIS